MKLIWIGAFVLLFASVASLVSNRQSGRLIEQSWARASNVLPDTELSDLRRVIPAYTARVFALLPDPFRQKFSRCESISEWNCFHKSSNSYWTEIFQKPFGRQARRSSDGYGSPYDASEFEAQGPSGGDAGA